LVGNRIVKDREHREGLEPSGCAMSKSECPMTKRKHA